MCPLPEQLSDSLATIDPLAIVAQDIGKAVDRIDQGGAVRRDDVLVQGGVTLGQANHAAKSRAPQLGIGKRPHRLGVRDADGEREVAQKGHLTVVCLGREDVRPRPDRADEAEPLIEGCELLPLVRRENPGLAAEQRCIAFAQAAALLAGDGVAAEESGRIGEMAGPFHHGPLHAGNIGDDRVSTDDAGQAVEDRPDLVDRRGDYDDVAVGQVTQIGRRLVDRATLLGRQNPILMMGDAAHLGGTAQTAKRQAERAADQTKSNDANPHQATPTVRFSAPATASTCSTRWANAFGVSDWAPSESATSGCACTSTMSPSAPAAMPASAIGVTRERLPVPWLGSTVTGTWLSSL